MSAAVCPECAAGKHVNCTGEALDEATDQFVACVCGARRHHYATAAGPMGLL